MRNAKHAVVMRVDTDIGHVARRSSSMNAAAKNGISGFTDIAAVARSRSG